MSLYIRKLIQQGEHQQQDFKFAINDSRKIARSMVAFANTEGGRLLVGVKDNGAVAGIRSDEEYYMIESAAQLYSKPEVVFEVKHWQVEGKNVMEVIIPVSEQKPHYAKTDDNKWMAYIRKDDQNLLAHIVQLKAWKKNNSVQGVHITYYDTQQLLFDYLNEHGEITLSKFSRIALITRAKAEHILSDLLALRSISMRITENQVYFGLNEELLRLE